MMNFKWKLGTCYEVLHALYFYGLPSVKTDAYEIVIISIEALKIKSGLLLITLNVLKMYKNTGRTGAAIIICKAETLTTTERLHNHLIILICYSSRWFFIYFIVVSDIIKDVLPYPHSNWATTTESIMKRFNLFIKSFVIWIIQWPFV